MVVAGHVPHAADPLPENCLEPHCKSTAAQNSVIEPDPAFVQASYEDCYAVVKLYMQVGMYKQICMDINAYPCKMT